LEAVAPTNKKERSVNVFLPLGAEKTIFIVIKRRINMDEA